MRDATFSVLEMLDHGKLFVDPVAKRTERNWLIAPEWLLDMLVAQR